MKLDDDDFTLFDLPARFALDRAVLDERWRALQSAAHPDRFASEGAAAQRLAMQWAVRINEAYQRLKDPLKRGAYLCELRGVLINAESNTAMPTAFLMQQMAWREALDDARGAPAIERAARFSQLTARTWRIGDIEFGVDRNLAQDYSPKFTRRENAMEAGGSAGELLMTAERLMLVAQVVLKSAP